MNYAAGESTFLSNSDFLYTRYNKLQQFCICFETYKSSAYCTQRLDIYTVISFFFLKGVTAF